MNKRVKRNRPKRYIAIIKIRNNPDGTAYCVKYRFNDLMKFTEFLDRNWTGWKWFNVFSNRGNNKGMQVASFTNKKRPVTNIIKY